MSELWYKKVGFYENPFSIKPAAFNDELVAYDLAYIYKKIEKGEMLFLEGEYGTGKTTILKNIIAHFKGKNRIIYYSFNSADNNFPLNKLLDGANTLVRKIAGLNVHNIIMLLDEVHTMKQADAKKLIKPYKEGIIKSVVFVSHDFDIVNFPEEFTPLLNGNIIKTVNLSAQEAIALVKSRIGNIELLSDKIIAKIFMFSGKNPRRLLEYCEDVSRYAVEMGDLKVSEYHINEILAQVIKEKQRKFKIESKKPAEKKIKAIEKEEKAPEAEKKETKKRPSKKVPEFSIRKVIVEEREMIPEPKPQKLEKTIETEQEASPEVEPEKKERKFKLNKLVKNEKKNALGEIQENAESELLLDVPKKAEDEEKPKEDTPEYKIYFSDE